MLAVPMMPLLPLLVLFTVCSAKPVRVAFVGNSYTYFNDLPSMFASLSASAGINITHSQVTPGGSSIFQHGNLSLSMGQQTLKMLSDPLGWDYVVFQDQSETPGGGKDTDDGLGPGVGQKRSIDALESSFAPLLRKANATAIFYSTWGRHDGDPPNAKCCGYSDFLSMNAATSLGYGKYAKVLAPAPTRVAPCGRAFELVYNASGSKPLDASTLFSCLYHHGSKGPPCNLDGFGEGGHPSVRGTYLIASVFFGAIHGKSPIGLSFVPPEISAEDATALKSIAHDAVFGRVPASPPVTVYE